MSDEHRHEGLEDSPRAAPHGGRGVAGGRTEDVAGGAAEAGARAAFRAARDAGLHESRRTRRRDDWNPGARRRLRGRSLGRPLPGSLSA